MPAPAVEAHEAPPREAPKGFRAKLGSRRAASLTAIVAACDAAPKAKDSAKAVRPNAGIEAAYRARLLKLIDEMNGSVVFWLTGAYRQVPPELSLALDELSSSAMRRAVRELARRWIRRFDDMAKKLAEYFAQSVADRTDGALKEILRESGWTIDWKMTDAQRDVLAAIVNENVGLIKSIPRESLQKVEGIVMRSVQAGYDMGTLRKDLQAQFAVTKRRAEFIARDQTAKTTAMLNRVRQLELGIEEAIWIHSHAGREPRPNHVRFGLEHARYDPKIGMWDPDADGKGKGRYILPGQLPNCRCVSRSVILGLEIHGSSLTVAKKGGITRVVRAKQ